MTKESYSVEYEAY